MKIVCLKTENVKRLVAVEIKPDGALVVIGGRNAQGKTSVLDSIAYLLGGKDLCPTMPIRKGQKSARVVADLGEITVERTWTEKGSYLTVKGKDNFKESSPQQVLDKLVGRLTFDPLAFTRLKPDAQAEALRNLVGMDVREFDEARKKAYDERTVINRQLATAKAGVEAIPVVEAADAEVSVKALMAELDVAEKHNRGKETLVETVEEAEASISDVREEIDSVDKELQALRDRIEVLKENRKVRESARENFKARLAEAQKALDSFKGVEVEPIKARIASADDVNRKVRQKQQRQTLSREMAELDSKSQAITKAISVIDATKVKALANAKFPVPGLSFGDSGVTFNGIPFEQASAAEQMRVSVAMGFALNPKLKVLLIRDGSLLDEENLAAIAKLAEENDGQVWIEKVGEGGNPTVIIEDGMVKVENPNGDLT